ncbi:hypothetical protein AV530_015673 [Patagioenas fasciata monilis]|uniref:Uncharacterized protein n=1 Tax=Patagioenas fasciata monilis TaxID=372326 RepID=A0A1V4KIF3_PATFA|nr:hypothetical protein AV530_015673 [Patagioenas fasciata monilis]
MKRLDSVMASHSSLCIFRCHNLFKFQDTFKVSSLSKDVSKRQSRNKNLGVNLLSYGNRAEVNMTLTIACITVGLSFLYYQKECKFVFSG